MAPDAVAQLEARDISKRFGGVEALDRATLTVLRGEVHGLVGENGSGKSTLVKILSGYHAPEPGGELRVGGHSVTLPLRPGEFRALGLSFAHQDLGLVADLTVAENLALGEVAGARAWHVSRRGQRQRARHALARLGLDVDPQVYAGDLSPAEQAKVAIARALDELWTGAEPPPAGLLVLDEPTAYLRRAEAELFPVLRAFVAGGASVLLVSHDLDEVLEATDRVTVLRDGRSVATEPTGRLDRDRLATTIVGRAPALTERRAKPDAAEALVSIHDLSGPAVERLSAALARGEIVGLTGRAGSGFDEVPYLLFGARAATAGVLEIAGSMLDLPSLTPARAAQAGIALVPGDRHRDGVVGSLAVVDNITLPRLRTFGGLHLDRRRMAQHTADLLERFGVRPGDPHRAFETLSGGNQQKALLAKWLAGDPALLLLDEPTRGIDVGARRPIEALVRDVAAAGAAVVCASSDDGLLADLCDRVLVFAGGQVADKLIGDEVTATRLAARRRAVGRRSPSR